MDQALLSHGVPVPYVQDNTPRARPLQCIDFDQDVADYYGRHQMTETTYLTPEYILNIAYSKRRNTETSRAYNSVGAHEKQQRIAEAFANQNYQRDMELMLGFNTEIDAIQGVVLRSIQQCNSSQSLASNLLDQNAFGFDERCQATSGNTENFNNPGRTAHLQQDVFSEPMATVSFLMETSHELPCSFKTNSTSGFSFSTVDSLPLSEQHNKPLNQSLRNWEFPTTQVSNNVQGTEVSLLPVGGSEPCLAAPLYVLSSQTSATPASSHEFSSSINSPFDYTSPTNEMMSSQVSSQLPTEERQTRDELLIECRRTNMSYKDIKEQYGFEQSISTLRGRYRNLTKQKHERVRKPNWTATDVSIGRL